ncbi:MAG: M67 family metallopeptidase [Planctomycetes bacterium]|nr:M67 family metallopeptidase [Planctomycetota bacterium]
MSTLAGRPTILQLPASTWQRLLRIARRDHPQECCGILVGRRIGGRVYVNHAVEGRNIASGDPRRTYQLDWPTLFATIRACREAGDEIVGFYHSHPNGSCEPSKRDLQDAWIEHSYLILGAPYHDVASAASWRISRNGDRFGHERLWIASEGGGTAEQAPVSGTAGQRPCTFQETGKSGGRGSAQATIRRGEDSARDR